MKELLHAIRGQLEKLDTQMEDIRTKTAVIEVEVKECRNQVRAVNKVLMIGNGEPPIIQKVTRNEGRIASLEEGKQEKRGSVRYWAAWVISLVSVGIAGAALFL